MILTYISVLTAFLECVNEAERDLKSLPNQSAAEIARRSEEMARLLNAAFSHCESLGLASADKQVRRIRDRFVAGNCGFKEMSGLLAELRVRIQEDLTEQVFFRIGDPALVMAFFQRAASVTEGVPAQLEFKRLDEFFDSAILDVFPEAHDDLEEGALCFLYGWYSASLFHMMRVTEVGRSEERR
jgi:hypothetical protein